MGMRRFPVGNSSTKLRRRRRGLSISSTSRPGHRQSRAVWDRMRARRSWLLTRRSRAAWSIASAPSSASGARLVSFREATKRTSTRRLRGRAREWIGRLGGRTGKPTSSRVGERSQPRLRRMMKRGRQGCAISTAVSFGLSSSYLIAGFPRAGARAGAYESPVQSSWSESLPRTPARARARGGGVREERGEAG
jgi:hypothetical protein